MTDEAQLVDAGYAEGWKPKPGDRITGRITDISATDGGYGVYPVLTVALEDGGEVAVHAFHTVLRRELARRRPKVGDELDVQYLGKKGDGGGYGRGYDVYRVRGGETGGYDWSRDLAEDERDRQDGPSVPIEPEPVPAAAELAPVTQEKAAENSDDDLPF